MTAAEKTSAKDAAIGPPRTNLFHRVVGWTTGCRPMTRVSPKDKYDVFISYSHKADRDIAPRLQSGLEKLAKPWYRRRAMRVFRDETDLGANPDMWSEIEQKLTNSRNLILLCSPEAAKSRWVKKEIDHWLALGRHENLFFALTEGEIVWAPRQKDFNWSKTTALPSTLKGRLKQEPGWVDLRKGSEFSKTPDAFRHAVARLSAPIRGLELEQLVSADHREHRRTLRHAWTAAACLLALALVASSMAILAYLQRQEALTARDRALDALRTQSRLIRDLSADVATNGDKVTAALLALEGLPDLGSRRALRQDWPYVAELEHHVFNKLLSPPEGILEQVRDASTHPVMVSRSGDRMIVGGDLYDAQNGKLIKTLTHGPKSLNHEIEFAKDGEWIVFLEENFAKVARAVDGGELPNQIPYPDDVQSIFIDPTGAAVVTIHTDSSIRLQKLGKHAKTIRTPEQSPEDRSEIATWARVSFGPKSRTFVLTLGNNTIELWDLANEQLISVMKEPLRILYGAVYDADGLRFLTLPYQQEERELSAHMYDANTGELLRVFTGHKESLTSVEFSGDGSRLLTASRDNTAKVWNSGTGEPIATMGRHTTDVVAAKFVGKRRDRVLTVGAGSRPDEQDHTFLRLWSADGTLIEEFGYPDLWVASRSIASDGTKVVFATNDHKIHIRSLEDGSNILTLNGHRSYVRSTLFSADGNRVISLSDDGTIRDWRINSSDQWRARIVEPPRADSFNISLPIRPARIVDLSVDSAGKRLTILVEDRLLRTFKLTNGKPKHEKSVKLARDSNLLLDLKNGLWAHTHGKVVSLRSLHEDRELDAVGFGAHKPVLAAIDREAGIWATATSGGVIVVRDFLKRREVSGFTRKSARIAALAIGGNGNRLITVERGGLVQWWDTGASRELARASIPAGRKHLILVGPKKSRALVVTDQTQLTLLDFNGHVHWSTRTGSTFNETPSSIGRRPVAAFSPTTYLVALAVANVIELRSMRDGTIKHRLAGHKKDVITWRDIGAIDYTSSANINDVAFTANGQRLVSASGDRTALVWNLSDGAIVGTYTGHFAAVRAILQEPVTSTGVPEFFLFGAISSVELIQDDQWAITASDDGTVRIWPLVPSTQALVNRIKSQSKRCLTPRQRSIFRLEPEPPGWCIEQRKWPYRGKIWQKWLDAVREGQRIDLPELAFEETE